GQVRRRHRSGHDQHAVHDLRPLRLGRRRRPEGARADLPEAGLGRARRQGDLAEHAGRRRGRAAEDGLRQGGNRGGRDHEPARDRARLGPQHGRAGLQRGRLAGHADRPARAGARPRRRARPLPAEGRPAAGDVLLRAEGDVDPRQRRGRARAGRGGRPGVRQHGHLADLEPDRRHGRGRVRDRPDQRQPHAGDGPPDAGLGRRDPRDHGDPALDDAGDPLLERRVRHDQLRAAAGPAAGGRPRRPAGGGVRPDLLRHRRREEHLRHRQLHAAEHGRGARALEERPADHRRLQDRRRAAHLLPGGVDRGHRLLRPVAARQPEADQGGAGGRGARDVRRGQRRLLRGPCVLGPVRAVLAQRRARGDRGSDALRERRAHRPGGARGHGLPDARGAGGHERGLRRRPEGAEGRRGHGRQRAPDAVPGRHPGRPGRAPAGGRDHLAGRGLRRRPGGRLLGVDRRAAAELAPGQGVDAADGRDAARAGLPPVEEGRHEDVRLGRGGGAGRCL
ncbi:MAG: Glycerol kinase, partial [uncultured Thermoleophilia bacterium]